MVVGATVQVWFTIQLTPGMRLGVCTGEAKLPYTSGCALRFSNQF